MILTKAKPVASDTSGAVSATSSAALYASKSSAASVPGLIASSTSSTEKTSIEDVPVKAHADPADFKKNTTADAMTLTVASTKASDDPSPTSTLAKIGAAVAVSPSKATVKVPEDAIALISLAGATPKAETTTTKTRTIKAPSKLKLDRSLGAKINRLCVGDLIWERIDAALEKKKEKASARAKGKERATF